MHCTQINTIFNAISQFVRFCSSIITDSYSIVALLSDNLMQKCLLSISDNLMYLNVKLYTISVDSMLVSDNLCAIGLIV